MNSVQENSEIVSQSSDKVVPEHLKSIFENISKSLTGSQIEQIKDLLIAYQDILWVLIENWVELVLLNTPLPHAMPIKHPPRRLSVKQKK